MNIKQLYQRFRIWQHKPFNYKTDSGESTLCQNCGTTFEGNFCPVCGQKAGLGRVGWSSVRQGVMILWGMDNRSLSYSIVQLLFRPGYFIRDYISGKRQVSFPPVKMLFIVAIGQVLANYLKTAIYPNGFDATGVNITPNKGWEFLDQFNAWFEANQAWGMLMFTGFFILPTWLLFRFAPRYPRHTLPEGFFLQVFMASIIMVVGIVSDLTTGWIMLLVPVYYMIAYKQLFGYGIWGTFWRLFICSFIVIIALLIISTVTFLVINSDKMGTVVKP